MGLNNKDKELAPEKLVQFIQSICKLDELEVIGLTNLMGISLMDSEKKPRDFEEVLSEIIDKYIEMNRDKRRKIDYVLNEVINGKDDADCGRAKKLRHKHKRKKK